MRKIGSKRLAMGLLGLAMMGMVGDAICPGESPATLPAKGRTLKIAPIPIPPSPYVTDAQIGEAIDKGADFLMKQFEPNGLIKGVVTDPTTPGKEGSLGADALAVYALEQCGLASDNKELGKNSPFIGKIIDAMKKCPVREGTGTYTRGIRLTALELLGRKEDKPCIAQDAQSLLDCCLGGGYTYGLHPDQIGSSKTHDYAKRDDNGDNSNSQYGLLGVWSASEAGLEIPNDYWETIEKHWNGRQLEDGQWCYGDPRRKGAAAAGADAWGFQPRLAMTAAGIASLFVCHDQLDIAKFDGNVGREPFTPALAKALDWLEKGDNCLTDDLGYTGYGVERIGLASGFKYFGTHDWYRELATRIVAKQVAGGPIMVNPSGVVGQSYALLFLSRGRHPLLMNKLRFDHFWANRPHDVANLAKYAGRELEKVFNWQVVNLQHDWFDWQDAPILYIASHEPPKLTDADYAKIRSYVEGGGMLFTQADGDKSGFNDWVQKVLVRKVFPDYELAKLPDNSPIYNCYMQVKGKPPELMGISNGSRLLMVHSPKDIARYWQQGESKSHAEAFAVGMNLFVYAAGKSEFRNRVNSPYVTEPPAIPDANTVKVARVKYALPTWNPEPYAWTRFSRWMAWQTGVGVKVQDVELKDLGTLDPADVPLADLTGTNAYSPNPSEIAAMQQYVNNGGVLLLDACGGGSFNDSIQKLLKTAFPKTSLAPLPPHSSLMAASDQGMTDLGKPQVRPYVVHTMGHTVPPMQIAQVGNGRIIYSTLDITNGLLDSTTWNIAGYTSDWDQNFMKNLVLWTARGCPETAPDKK